MMLETGMADVLRGGVGTRRGLGVAAWVVGNVFLIWAPLGLMCVLGKVP